MKSLITPISIALAAAQGATALPSGGTGHRSNSTTDVSPSTGGGDFHAEAVTVSVNCNELINQVLAGVSAYPEFAAQAVAVGKKVGLPAGTAFSVCKMFKTDAVDCTYAAGSVAGAISLAITNGYIDLVDGGADAANPSKRSFQSFQDQLESHLARHGVHWDALSVVESRPEASISSSSTSGGHHHQAQLRGAKFPGRPATNFDIVKHQQGGGGFVHATPSSRQDNSLGRRQDTFGFKVNYEVFNRAGTPSSGAYDSLAQTLANDWNSRVTAEQDIGDYIGLADFGYMGYIQFRIIPETAGYGLDEEDIGTCAA